MKKITLLSVAFLIVVGLNASSKIENIQSGSTIREYSKPGAPVDMEFNTTHVDINATSDVNLTLITTVRKGNFNVLITLDDNLTTVNELDQNLSFVITPERQKFLINFQVKSEKQGLFYIRLLTQVDQGHGLKLRSFAVPVYIGKKPKTLVRSSPQMKALANGENISISKAIETIRIIKEK